MINIEQYRPRATLFKTFFNSHNVSLGTIANYLDKSYPYVCNMINGIYRMTPEIERKLVELADALENGGVYTNGEQQA